MPVENRLSEAKRRLLILASVVIVLVVGAASVLYGSDFPSGGDFNRRMALFAGRPTVVPRPSASPTLRPTRTPRPTMTPVPTATPVPGAVDSSAYGITYQDWQGVSDPQASGGGYRASSIRNRALRYTTSISTTTITLVTYRGPDQGIARLTVDDQELEPLDLYAETPEYRFEHIIEGLSPAPHTIIVRPSGRRNDASTGDHQVRVDAFRIGDVLVEDNDLDVRYGPWAGFQVADSFGGNYRRSSAADSLVSFGFTGTQVIWITARCSGCGQAEISIDGTPIETIDLYAPDFDWRYLWMSPPLSPGTHEVQIRVLDARALESRGNNVIFDGFGVP
jgi:hypothetical protein